MIRFDSGSGFEPVDFMAGLYFCYMHCGRSKSCCLNGLELPFLWYFEWRNAQEDRYDELLECLNTKGFIGNCLHMATLWFECDVGMENGVLENAILPDFKAVDKHRETTAESIIMS